MFKAAFLFASVAIVASSVQAGEVWPWAFKQNPMEVGVKFVERRVAVEDGEIRTWEKLYARGETLDREGKLVEVQEKYIHVLLAGFDKPVRFTKQSLEIPDAVYVQNLEIQLATEAKEPGFELLTKVTEEEVRKRTEKPKPLARRLWTQKDGLKRVGGVYGGMASPTTVIIRIQEGSEIRVKLNTLSKADQDYVKEILKKERAEGE